MLTCDAHTELSLKIRAGEFWWVSDEVGKEISGLKSKVVWEEDQLTPPLHGWQYYVSADGGKWNSDPALVCSREVRVGKLAGLTL